ncbi:hypothetical protein [Halalkalibacter alkaliphilus]|uniref:Uncharacterized protein n=1 Tax=Halalkalibacter alkaliphilus TaxID=2917993 RepID=A0A9X2I8W9_9BACI|nr:hypothetical protein [Halalkalibacter alkaliphilus]MCL7748405.1 hypothetical protein [Halalkalibacter alkaliphilus]
MTKKIIDLANSELEDKIKKEVQALRFTKNFRSASAEEWYVFLESYHDPKTGGAAGKAIIHYDLQGNRDIYINTTIIFDAPELYNEELDPLVYAIADELVNRLVGYANTLLSVHAGRNSYEAEYIR